MLSFVQDSLFCGIRSLTQIEKFLFLCHTLVQVELLHECIFLLRMSAAEFFLQNYFNKNTYLHTIIGKTT